MKPVERVKKKCLYCNIIFYSLQCKKQKYCCKKCKNNASRANLIKKKCPQCKTYFLIKDYKYKTYCSKQCSSNSQKVAKIKSCCKHCKTIIYIYPYEINTKHYCSFKCASSGKKVKLKKCKCELCKKYFYRTPFWAKVRKYCSSICQKNAMVGKTYSEETLRKMSEGHKNPSDDLRKMMRINRIKYIEKCRNNGDPISPTLGNNETDILNQIAHEFNCVLERQYRIDGFFVDGYDKTNNVVYEVEEQHHIRQKEKDLRREQYIINKLDCEFVRILDYNEVKK